MMLDPNPRRRACDELADLLATPEGLRTARLLQLTEVMGAPQPASEPEGEAETGAPKAKEGRPISIWQPRTRGEEQIFERPAPLPLGDHYAAGRTIVAAKPSGVTRICFFGESVAAGYLYAPRLTPAGVLERLLGSGVGEGVFEVIDFARTNATLGSLVTTVERSLQLDPDLLVIFAGNNWNLLETPDVSPYVPSVRARQRYALALRRAGLAGPPELARRDLEAGAKKALAAIAAARIPVIVVIPEVNLADWEDRQPVAWLPGDGSERWHARRAEAEEHLADGRFEAALATADAMEELDGGQCATTHRLRGIALQATGRTEGARRACEAEVAAGSYATLAFLSAPRASTAIQEILRREATRHAFRIVDLPRRFAEHGGSPLPGRRLFLDYCHLSAKGIEVAMTTVADEILRHRGEDGLRAEDARAPEIEPEVEAVARLGAAVHGAHRLLSVGGKRPYLERWCREALAADPAVAAAMRDLLIARCGPCPAVLTRAQQRNLASPHRLLLQHGWRWDYLDVELIEALCGALEDAGHEVRGEIDALLVRHHGVGERGVDLSRPPYLWEPLERFYPEAMAVRGNTGRATHRSPWPETRFCLIADAVRAVTLDLTTRLPAIDGTPDVRCGEVVIRLNGRQVGSLEAGESWARRSVLLARGNLRPAINRLTLVWPALPAAGDAAIESAVRRLENGVQADLHPVFGEVFSLTATTTGVDGLG